jgi:hypothetical protein
MPAVGYVLEPRPTNAFEDEDDDEDDYESVRAVNREPPTLHPSFSTC